VVFTPGRPETTVDRAGYVFCVLELFHQRLRRRGIFALASTRWADPRAQLLTGTAWDSARGAVLSGWLCPDESTPAPARKSIAVDVRDKAAGGLGDGDRQMPRIGPGVRLPSLPGQQLGRAGVRGHVTTDPRGVERDGTSGQGIVRLPTNLRDT